jgi:uncharacterized protein (TIGR03437 family)
VAAGSIASVFGINLASGQAMAGSLPLPTTLESSSFQIGGQVTPLFSASPAQVNLQIPWALAGQSQAMLTATVGSLSSTPQVVNIAVFAPGLFLLNGGTSVTAGQFISIYATGLGPVSNRPATGGAAGASPLSVTLTAPTVTIGGVAAPVGFSGLAPGAVGLYQVNVQVPAGVVSATAPVILTIGGVASNTVTIAVH